MAVIDYRDSDRIEFRRLLAAVVYAAGGEIRIPYAAVEAACDVRRDLRLDWLKSVHDDGVVIRCHAAGKPPAPVALELVPLEPKA